MRKRAFVDILKGFYFLITHTVAGAAPGGRTGLVVGVQTFINEL